MNDIAATEPEETTPDELMNHFKGRSLKSILVFTVVIHAVVLLGTSIPFLLKTVMGTDTSDMSEDERIEQAVRKATTSLRSIAEEHGISPDTLSSQFSGKKKPASSAQVKQPAEAETPGSTPETPDDTKSTIEKELEVKKDGPEIPEFSTEDEDLF